MGCVLLSRGASSIYMLLSRQLARAVRQWQGLIRERTRRHRLRHVVGVPACPVGVWGLGLWEEHEVGVLVESWMCQCRRGKPG